MKQFTTRKRAVTFTIDDDVFALRPVIAASTMFEFSNVQTQLQEVVNDPRRTAADVILEAFSKILTDESFETFNARFFGVGQPIDLETFNEVTIWIIGEAVGKDLTQLPKSSENG